MLNILLGPPGGGKSYEAVAFHVMPALAKGRKVITNLPLVLDNFAPGERDLIEIRSRTKAQPRPFDPEKAEQAFKRFGRVARVPEFNTRPFSNVEDYGDPWRHPDDGYGPLYVIDECHLSLPKVGTPVAVEEWFSLHRHEFADVLLISQSHGKVNRNIKELCQNLYRVKKASAFGFQKSYIRKVYDGLNGDCVNTGTRTYQKRFFKYYKSHTLSQGEGKEQGANDITPIYKRWPFVLAPICLIAAVALFARNGANPVSAMAAKGSASPVAKSSAGQTPGSARASMSTPTPGHAPGAVAAASSAPPGASVPASEVAKPHPLAGFGLHLAGVIRNAARGTLVLFQVSQNGIGAFTMNERELVAAGYGVKVLSECVARVSYKGVPDMFVVCDMPRVGMSPGANMPGSSTVTKSTDAGPVIHEIHSAPDNVRLSEQGGGGAPVGVKG